MYDNSWRMLPPALKDLIFEFLNLLIKAGRLKHISFLNIITVNQRSAKRNNAVELTFVVAVMRWCKSDSYDG